MKRTLLTPLRYQLACEGWLLGAALLLCVSARAQNLLNNGDFESPFPVSDPTAGWAVVYPTPFEGGPDDWAIVGPSTEASRCCGGRGAHLRANNWGTVHAYFKQVVTNLTEGASYTLTVLKMQGHPDHLGFEGDGIQRVYMSAVSGVASNVVHANNFSNGPFSLTITCSASRQIAVELHNWKRWMANENAEDAKHMEARGWFDDVSLTLTP